MRKIVEFVPKVNTKERTMNRLLCASLFAFGMSGGAVLHAQESLMGNYSGNFTPSSSGTVSPRPVGVQLAITSEEKGVIKGTAKLISSWSTSGCTGEYPMTGKYQNGKLIMRSTSKGGSSGDCSFSFNAVKEGNKLVGTTGTTGKGSPLQLSK